MPRSALPLPRPSPVEDNAASRLFGSWRLVSFQVGIVGKDASPRDIFGPHPLGRIMFTPDHYMTAYLSAPDRQPPTNEREAAALLNSMIAYTGRFRLEGDKFITTVDGAWTEVFRATEQVRYFTLDGDTLAIRTPEQASGSPGERVIATVIWERER